MIINHYKDKHGFDNLNLRSLVLSEFIFEKMLHSKYVKVWIYIKIFISKKFLFTFWGALHSSQNIRGPLHVLRQVSFGCWVTWFISSWQEYYKSVFFPKAEWWVAELLFLSLNNWGLNFLQNECSQSSQIYLLPENWEKKFTSQSWNFFNFVELPSGK